MTAIESVGVHASPMVRPYALFLRAMTRLAALVSADILAFATGYFLFRFGEQMPEIVLGPIRTPNSLPPVDVYAIMGAVFIAARYIFGDYGRRQLFWDGARATTSTLALAAIPDFLLVAFLGKSTLYAPLVASWLFLVPALPLYRQFARWLMSRCGIWQIPTALIGTGRNARDAYSGLKGTLSLGFDVRYLVVGEAGVPIPSMFSGLQIVQSAGSESVSGSLLELGCRQALVAAEDAQGPETGEVIQRLIGANINVAIIPFLRGLPLFGLSTNYLFGKDILLMQLRNNLARVPSRAAKRIVDLVGPILLLALFSPFLLAIALAIKLDDGGPIFFSQPRIGRGGRNFRCIKFRTMATDAKEKLERWREENPALYAEYMRTFKLRDDPRVTKIGKFMRRTSLDEIPQLVNVLKGEMSLVGPRPVVEQELVQFYGPAAELYKRVRPGLTGLWQISGRSDTTYSDRVSYDEWYILNWSLWYDFVILIQTAWIVLSGKGAF
ncbi:MAG TPA: undecaprenyl-phosphate galactose phosphotransferase WbaP [Rhizomicrobium sp.]